MKHKMSKFQEVSYKINEQTNEIVHSHTYTKDAAEYR